MVNLSLEDIDNDIDKVCIEVIVNIMINVLVVGFISYVCLDIEVILFDKVKVELERISLVVYEFIELKLICYKIDIIMDEVIRGDIEGFVFVIFVCIIIVVNKKELEKLVDWCLFFEEVVFVYM